MQQIALYLQRFKNLGMETILARETVISLLEKRLSIKISKEQVVIKKDTVYITAHPVVRNEIFLQRDALVALLEAEIGKNSIKKVR